MLSSLFLARIGHAFSRKRICVTSFTSSSNSSFTSSSISSSNSSFTSSSNTSSNTSSNASFTSSSNASFTSSSNASFTSSSNGGQPDLSKIRNIGIIAHIDAGKTTTTERMLFYSGFTPTMGEVHDGDTITDYLPQERERGITITSATISFAWKKHTVNLIDTPGHVDFTVEVERSLRVLDGAVTIIDASAGVEAQTLTVWKQADRYRIPRIIYLNKMDKPKACFDSCLKDIEMNLHLKPLVCQIPSFNSKTKRFCGVFDLITMTELVWHSDDGSRGSEYHVVPAERSPMLDVALEKRAELIEALAALDDCFAERFVLSNDEPKRSDFEDTLRKVTEANTGVPLLCGSSYKNIGVQPLLDSILKFLPDPTSSAPDEVVKYFDKNDTVALAFKIIHTKYKGALTFVRVYSGSLQHGKKVHIMNREISEKCGELLIANADEYVPIKTARRGDIVAVSGLKETVTGDTLVGSSTEAAQASRKANGKSAVLFGIWRHEPVFQCSIEPPSVGQQNQLDYALRCLQREDPSLTVTVQPDTGQTIISGMGSLHLDVVKDRIKREYNVNAYFGPMQISYREMLQRNLTDETVTIDKSLAGTKQYVEINLNLVTASKHSEQMSLLTLEPTDENGLHQLKPQHKKALENGVKLSLAHGPLLGFPLIRTQVVLTHFVTTPSTSLSMVTAAISQCIHQALRRASSQSTIDLLEPFMQLQVNLPQEYLGAALSDLSKRRASIQSIRQVANARVISILCPLAELKTYSTELRTLTSGRGTFIMELDSYKIMSPREKSEVIRKASGYL